MTTSEGPHRAPANPPSKAASAARRFWERRSKGERVSVDDVLDLPASDAQYMQTRATTIRLIADEAHKSTAQFDDVHESNSERATLDSAAIPAPTVDPASAAAAPTPVVSASAAPASPSAFGSVSSTSVNRSDPTPLPKIDGYDIISCLGRGGMGVVFEGYQQSTGRRVAIKFMLDAALASEAARKRFEREVEVVARLQHPGIVSIIDSGVRKGKYFYVMEYVEGRPLDLAMPAGQCNIHDAFRMMIQICDAVDYAHQRGILHRDLKPSNIIVDHAGQPHLLDFGLAKLVEDDTGKEGHGKLGLTMSQPGQLLGTIAYMSPEQAAGKNEETSVRTDVYALGAILFELITGELPIRMGGSLKEILHWIAEEEPTLPSKIRKGLDKDIDAILLKPVEKKPDNRYATAGEFAADIKRYLAHEPIIARRVGPVGRSWRWVQRNRALSTAIAVASVTLVAVSTTLILQILSETKRANDEARNAKEQAAIARSSAAEADRQKSKAEDNLKRAQENYRILSNILKSAVDENQAAVSVDKMLTQASDRLDKTPPSTPQTESDIRATLGETMMRFGLFRRAIANLSRAVEVSEKAGLFEESPESAEVIHNLAAAYWWDGQYDKAESYYVRSLAMRRRLFPGDHRDIALSLTHLAACRLRQGRVPEAKELYTEALDMRRRLFGQEHEQVAASLNNLAKCYQEAEDDATAENLFRQALEMITRVKGDKDDGTAAASYNLAAFLLERGDASGALDHFSRALRIREERTKALNGRHFSVAAAKCAVAQAHLALGHLDEASAYASEALDLYTQVRRADHPDLADANDTMARVLFAQGKFESAVTHWRTALKVAQECSPPAPLVVAHIEGRLGECLAALARPDEAAPLLVSSLSKIRTLKGDQSRQTAAAATRLRTFYLAQGERERADQLHSLANQKPSPSK